ncbi:MAG TPA: helix-turn-helix transcriptional regulator, partial [Candidatus Limnocylindria bacterium]
LVEHRIGALPTATVRLLATAAMTPAASLALLGEVHAGVDAAAALAPAVSAGVLLEPPEAGGTVAFAHPLLASAAIAALPTSQRRELQRALADAVTDVVERARHLAQSTTEADAGVAAQLEAAAAEAIRRGAPSVAAELAAVARGVTPADDRTGADRRASAEAEYRFEAGDAAGASTILDELIARVPKGQPRARLLSHRARIAHFSDDVGAGVSLLREALEEAGDDRRLRGEIEEGLAWGLMLMRADLAQAVTHAASAARHAADVGDEALQAEALAAAALTRMVVGRPSTALMKEAVALEPATRGFRVLRHPSFALGYQLSCMDELDAARDVFGDLSARAAERGDESAMASILGHLALIEALAGDLGAAETLATEAHELALESGQRPMRAAALGRIALARAMRGDAAAAREAASASLRLAGGDRFDPARPASALARGGEVALWSSGLLDVSLGSWSDAIRCLGPLSDHMLNAGVREPGELRFLIDEVEALVAMGEFDRASKRIDALDGIATRSRRPSARVTVAIGRGLHAAAMGDHEAAISILGASVPIAERLPLPILHGRTLLALGRVERRARRRAAARATLTAARDRFETIGAHGWAASAERELGRIGGRTSSGGELTSTEANVARLVATGKSNREVAAALFVTPKAIEASLARIYAKRGVRSRTQLAHLLAEEASGKQ